MTQPKRHHWLAMSYQKVFSLDQKSIYTYDLKCKEVKRRGIINNAVEGYYYSFPDKSGNPKNTEIETSLLAEIDGEYPNLINRIQKKESLKKEYDYLRTLMAVTYARVPKQRTRWERVSKELNGFLVDTWKEHLKQPKETADLLNRYEKETGKKLNEEERKKFSESIDGLEASTKAPQGHKILGMMSEIDVYLNVVRDATFSVLVAEEGNYFITCDNPADKKFLPLSPKFCLVMFNPKFKCEDYMTAPMAVVDKLNSLTINKANSYLYFQDRNQLKI